MSPFTPELRLHDRFVLRDRIGLGGMSEVWRADDEVLHRSVAVKALASSLAADPELRATIQREARAAARLTHPHVTQVYDYGEATLDGGVVPYLVMELVTGQTLAERLTRGPLPWPEAVRIGSQVAGALAAAHRLGVVHCDIKPGNVMLTATGAKVLDFGIAALTGTAATGPIMGTPAYVPPERLAAGPPTPAGDTYALGVLLYLALTGRLPVPGDSWTQVLEAHRRGVVVPPLAVPGLPVRVAGLVMACLAVDPAKRPDLEDLALRLGDAPPKDAPTTMMPAVTATGGPPPDGAGRGYPATSVMPPGVVPGGPVGQAGMPVAGRARPMAPVSPAAGTSMMPQPTAAPSSRRPLLLVGGLLAGALALAIVVALVVSSGGSDPHDNAALPSTPATVDSSSSGESTPSEATAPDTVEGVLGQIEAVIAAAESARQIEPKVANELRNRVNELGQPARGKGGKGAREQRKRIEELRGDLAELVDKGKMPDSTADQVNTLLDQLEGLRAGNGNNND